MTKRFGQILTISILLSSTAVVVSAPKTTQTIEYPSKSPYEFSELLNDLKDSSKTEITGHLRLPKTIKDKQKVPLVIVAGATFGIEPHHKDYLERLNKNGIATFTINSFKSRNKNPRIAAEQSAVSPEMMLTDAYYALKKLRKHPNIDSKKIGLMGWGTGGGAAIYAAWRPVKKVFLKNKKGFSAFLGIYPPCLAFPEKNTWVKRPIKIIIGDKDQSTPAPACKKLIKQIQKSGTPASIDIIKNAYHSFDHNERLKIHKNSYNFENCRFVLKPNGITIQPETGIKLINPLFRLAAFFNCTIRTDVTSGRHCSKVKQKAINDTVDFFQKSFE